MTSHQFRCTVLTLAGLLLAVSIAGVSQAQGAGGATLEEAAAPGGNYAKAEFRLWVPKDAGTLQGTIVLVPGSNGDGRSMAEDSVWQAFATRHKLALVGCHFTDKPHDQNFIEEYVNVSQGSGQALLDALVAFAGRSKHSELATAPLLLWGMSAGGQFNYEFVAWKPDRVIAFVVNKGGIYYSALLPRAARNVPGILFIGGKDLESRVNTITGLFAVNRRGAALWALANEPGAAHIVGRSRDVALIFFEDVLPLRLGAPSANTSGPTALKPIAEKTGFIGDIKSKTFHAMGDTPAPNYPTDWFPTARVARAWQAMETEQPFDQATSSGSSDNPYADSELWLCRPGRQDACAVDLSTTVIAANGTLTREEWAPNANAPIDCFYVYPTVSSQPTPNSDRVAGAEEKAVAHTQFARFGSVCRPYAPLYRQVTLTALRDALAGQPTRADGALAYHDVLDAWNYYLEHDNNGRGVVLIGHSQGSNLLTQLIKAEIDGKSEQQRLVSALLLGTNLQVPRDDDVGGAFQHVPLCHSATQTGCVITYVSFRSTTPPPANSYFGRVAGPDMVAGCTNPAALGGGSGELHAYLTARGSGVAAAADGAQRPWVTPPQSITTPFVSVPGLLAAECVSNAKGSYLAITVHGHPGDARTSDIAGDVVVAGQVRPEWGLHLIDMNLAQGNLIDIVRQEGSAYIAASDKR